MKSMFPLLFLVSTASAAPVASAEKSKAFFEKEFDGKKGCFVLLNAKTKAIEDRFGGEQCAARLAPLSTFKTPLALMAFESGYFKSIDQVVKWDGKDEGSSKWNRDQTPKTFIENSVIWVSRKIVDHLGPDKVRKYLKEFSYGNMSVDGDFHNFWLTSGSLKISAAEQAEFLAKLWTGQLPVAARSRTQVREILRSDSVRVANVFGKTGSGCLEDVCDGPKAKHYGWFSGVIEIEKQTYAFALQYSDQLSSQGWAGPKAKKIFYRYLEQSFDRLNQ
jgi:beta-lactamase class D